MKSMIIATFIVAFIALLFTACKPSEEAQQFIDLSHIDSTVRPQDDFFQFANGSWLDNTEIPSTEAGWGSFYMLREKSTQDLNSILKELESGKQYKQGSLEQLVSDFYRSGMDSVHIEELGISPLLSDLDRIAAIQSPEEILPEIAFEITTGRVPLSAGQFPYHILSFYIYQDAKNSEKMAAQFDQGDLGLPEKDYYLSEDSSFIETRADYRAYLKTFFLLLGNEEAVADERAERVLQLETKLATASKTRTELRDPIANYNKYTLEEVDAMMPNIDWMQFISDLGIETDTILMGQPEYYKAFAGLLYTEPVEAWKDMLTFWMLRCNAGSLSNDFVQNNFDFYARKLRGQQEIRPRWKRMARTVNNELRDAIGQLYVERFFPPEAKQRMDELIDNLISAYEERILAATWMNDSTKEKALEKLQAINRKIGYPDKWDDYAGVEITRDDYLANLQSTRSYGYSKMIDKLGKPVDPDVWMMTPSTVNAYYSRSNNEIVFPAGILQPPFFNKDADDAVNYGAIGVVIGHEITHGFDDKGRLYDAEGNMNEWWTEEDAERYEKQTAPAIAQANAYTVLDSLPLKGELTQGENIADLGGLTISYNAFKKTAQGQSDEQIDGLTPDQRFFLSYAKVWMIKTTDEYLRQQVQTDPHPPAKYRVNGALSNVPEFFAAFDVKEGDAMYRPESEHVVIW